LEGGGGRKGAVLNPSGLGLVFSTATGFRGSGAGIGGEVVAGREKVIMESVWKLFGGVGVILSICWIPA